MDTDFTGGNRTNGVGTLATKRHEKTQETGWRNFLACCERWHCSEAILYFLPVTGGGRGYVLHWSRYSVTTIEDIE